MADRLAKEFCFTVTRKTPSKRNSRSTEETKSHQDAFQRESFEAKRPIIMGQTINQDESIPETADGEAIAKSNIHMHRIKVGVCYMSPF